jgi:hypothetical protein
MLSVQFQQQNVPFANLVSSKSKYSLYYTQFLHHSLFIETKCDIAIQNQPTNKNQFGIARPQQLLNVELDVEKRLQAVVLKDRVRIKQFFIDFDRLRKGTVGEAAVRMKIFKWPYSSEHVLDR